MHRCWMLLAAGCGIIACADGARAQVGAVNVCARVGNAMALRAIPGRALGDHVLLPDGRVVLPSEIDSSFIALEPSSKTFDRNWVRPNWKLFRKLRYVPLGGPRAAPVSGRVLGGSAAGTPYLVDIDANPKFPENRYLVAPGCRLMLLMPRDATVDVRDPCARPGEMPMMRADLLRKLQAWRRQHPRASDPPRCR